MKNPVTFRSDEGGGVGGGGGGHPDPEIRGGTDLKKNFFRPLRPQFGLKIEGAPLLDPPL